MTDEKAGKLNDLRELILQKAEAERGYSLSNARKEAGDWVDEQNSRLEQAINGIIMDAKKRAEEIRRREVMTAERDSRREKLRLQNSLLSDSISRLESGLETLADRPDYSDILCGLVLEGVASMPSVREVHIRLSERDGNKGRELEDMVSSAKPDLRIIFDPEPAPINGGVWLMSADGKWQSQLDWGVKAAEMTDILAERLLSVL